MNRVLSVVTAKFRENECIRLTFVLAKLIIFFPLSLGMLILGIYICMDSSAKACFASEEYPTTMICGIVFAAFALGLYVF